MAMNSRSIDRFANGEVLKLESPRIPIQALSKITEMALDIRHHCPVCSKKGNRRCVKLGHLIECDVHRGKYHSRLFECVSCAEACAREEKATKKDRGSNSGEDENKQQKKDRKRGKVKPTHEKTMKQLRQELREEKRKSSTD